MSDLRTEEGRHRLATENVNAKHRAQEVEQQCRSVARFYRTPEEEWREYIPLLVVVEEGRLMSVQLDREKPENQAAFAEYMRNR